MRRLSELTRSVLGDRLSTKIERLHAWFFYRDHPGEPFTRDVFLGALDKASRKKGLP